MYKHICCGCGCSRGIYQDYQQSDRATYPSNYRHSQSDLTDWEEQKHHQQQANTNRRNVARDRIGDYPERTNGTVHNYRNNSRESQDWISSEDRHRDRP